MTVEGPKVLFSSDTVVEASSEHKPIQAVALDPSGARMVTGGAEGVLKYWDFAGMNCVDPRPFREFIPVEAHPINALSFSAVGTLVLCVTSDSRARIFDREGSTRPIEETIKGDQYIRTPENTKGHTHMLSYGEFHPKENHRFLTASYDSTVRLWDLNTKRMGMDQNIPNVNCFKCTDARGICGGNRLYASTAAYSSEGSVIMGGCSDGSLHMFNDKTRYGKGQAIVRGAHGGEVTGINFANSDSQLLTRGMDDCVKLWDLRKFKDPVRTWSGVATARSGSNISLSPDSRYAIAGTASGELIAIDLESGDEKHRKKLPTRQVISTKWHSDLNQVVATSSDGNIFMFFDPIESRKGALLFVEKQPGLSRQLDQAHAQVQANMRSSEVFSYEELIESGQYRENRQGQLKEVKQRDQKIAFSNKIEPIRGGGVMQALLLNRKRTTTPAMEQEEQSSAASEGLVSSAYEKTQPRAVLDYSESQGSVDGLLGTKKQYCPQCGLKMCTCGFMTGRPLTASAPISGPQPVAKRLRFP